MIDHLQEVDRDPFAMIDHPQKVERDLSGMIDHPQKVERDLSGMIDHPQKVDRDPSGMIDHLQKVDRDLFGHSECLGHLVPARSLVLDDDWRGGLALVKVALRHVPAETDRANRRDCFPLETARQTDAGCACVSSAARPCSNPWRRSYRTHAPGRWPMPGD
jgi:hypothetical protein